MECKNIRERLTAFLEGVVTLDEQKLIKEHLVGCEQCTKALDDLRKTEVLLKGLQEVEPPPWFTQKIMARVRAEKEAKSNTFQRLFYPLHVKVPIHAVITFLIAVAVIYVFKAMEPEMAKVRMPSVSEQVVRKDEAPKELLQLKKESQTLGEEAGDKRVEQQAVEATRSTPAEPPAQTMLAEKKQPMEAEQVEDREKKDAVTGYSVEERALGGPPRFKAAAKQKEFAINLSVRLGEIKAAAREVETLLGRLGAEGIGKESSQNREVITAELRAEKMDELIEKLKEIGEVKEPVLPKGIPGGKTTIRIELVSLP
jgi:hypothetical protein